MWIARDKDGKVHLFYYKPYRVNNNLWTCDVPGVEASWHHWEQIVGYWMKLDDSLFPGLKWNDEPVEVMIIEKDKLFPETDFVCKFGM